MGKLDLVDADLINPASGNRSHLERALFHFQQEHIILLCTGLFHLHLECTLPVPPTTWKPCCFVPAILSRCLDPASTSATSSSNLHLLRHHLLRHLLLMYIPYLRSLIRATSWSGAGPDLICCQREACLWADGPLWSRSSSSSSYKLALFTCCLYAGPAASRSPLTLPPVLFSIVASSSPGAVISLIPQN